jgi:hypothetical protein
MGIEPMMRSLAAMLALAAPIAAAAQDAAPMPAVRASPALAERAADLVTLINGGGDPALTFAPGFLMKIPAAQVRAIFGQLVEQFGKATAVQGIEAQAPLSGTVSIAFERAAVTMRMALDPSAGNRISGLLVTGTAAREGDLQAVVASLKALPGLTGFSLARLDGPTPTPILALDGARPLAIGSAFKLVILAELVRAVNAGERRWSDTVPLHQPLPGGILTRWPEGSPITLHSLATMMITVSDNAATDTLLFALGREKVEAMMPVVGIADPARNRPFLSTMEMFKLKGWQGGRLAAPWETANETARRRLLAGEVAGAAPDAIDQSLFAQPNHIATIEWFESPDDLVRVMNWLRLHSEKGAGAEARRILAVNPGIPAADAASWAYVGYKGGSESGVIAMSLLLQSRAGHWYALAAGWNDPAKPTEDARFTALVTRAVALVER